MDEEVNLIVADLKRAGRFENSIIVIWSDHGRAHRKNRRLPLIIKFPDKPVIPPKNLGWNTQTLDIAPTLLDYLDVPIPGWMEGRSLLRPIDRYEPIFATVSHGKDTGIDPGPAAAVVKGGLTELGVIVCNYWFNAHLESGRITKGRIRGHSTPCDREQLPSESELECVLAKHLVERDYKRVIGNACQ
jgi:hypothetical protein